ncbi:hypothetical protein B0H11DRAFT_2197864 [Mycena galericulata]|nr:hypothetical protein B0H11DRAFT_2197864 [Mycena galericulata]
MFKDRGNKLSALKFGQTQYLTYKGINQGPARTCLRTGRDVGRGADVECCYRAQKTECQRSRSDVRPRAARTIRLNPDPDSPMAISATHAARRCKMTCKVDRLQTVTRKIARCSPHRGGASALLRVVGVLSYACEEAEEMNGDARRRSASSTSATMGTTSERLGDGGRGCCVSNAMSAGARCRAVMADRSDRSLLTRLMLAPLYLY